MGQNNKLVISTNLKELLSVDANTKPFQHFQYESK